jgi:hypothetical protein
MTHRTLPHVIGALALSAGLALIPTGAAAAPEAGQGAMTAAGIAGHWRLMGHPQPHCGAMPFVNFTAIARDGHLVNVDPMVGTGVGAVRHIWKKNYKARFHGFIVDGSTTWSYEVRGELSLDHADQFSGTFATDVTDLSGNVVCTYNGTLLANRI